MIPTLTTPRLTLRPMTFSDWPAYLALFQSPRAAFMGGPLGVTAAWGVFCHDIAQWPLFGFGALMIEDRATGTTLGQVGISGGPRFPETELGWFLYDGHEGQGFATEAALSLCDWAFAHCGLTTLVSYIDPRNAASARVAERLGARLDPEAKGQDEDDLVYRHPHPRVAA
jgi:RimJ/RimL family protein N-acetyltransferase